MFNNTLRRLTALNSLVFLLIFIVFAAIIYGYISFRLFDRIDDAMKYQANSFRLSGGRIQLGGRPLLDPRIFLLLRGADGRVISSSPFRAAEIGNVAEIAATITAGEPQTKEYENHVYRIISVPYRFEERSLNSDERFVIREVIAVSIVDSEVGLLNHLFWIMLGSLILAMIGIVSAGYYLARRAMVPIQVAWEKQQQFVSDASHELRSPITGIHSNAELMLRHPGHTIEQESHRINTIIQESSRMTRLIGSLLTLARSDANKAHLHLEQVNLSELMEAIVAGFKATEELRGIALTADIKPKLYLAADRERLHQLAVILMDNAFKYTPAGGLVHVACFLSDNNVAVTVEDTGIGISSENLPRIFDRFYRGDKARSRESGGIGLGLAIAKWIVETHGGKITVQSEAGKGTKFSVYLPSRQRGKDG
jgi:signal transduction histidine kinase